MKALSLSGAVADRAACERFFAAQGDSCGTQHARFREAFIRALRTELTTRQREVLRLKYAEGLTGREIAARWDISPSAVSRHISRAQRRLRQLLAYNLEWRGVADESAAK